MHEVRWISTSPGRTCGLEPDFCHDQRQEYPAWVDRNILCLIFDVRICAKLQLSLGPDHRSHVMWRSKFRASRVCLTRQDIEQTAITMTCSK